MNITTHIKGVFFCFIFLFFSQFTFSQPWMNKISEEKRKNQQINFYEIQAEFNEWCEKNNVEKGYIYKNGKKQKVPYWKLFKRWEWYWETRINPSTGEFSKTSSSEQYQKYLKENPQTKSPAGNWQSLGPNSSTGGYAGIGRLNCIAFRPSTPSTLYAGAASGGLWKSSNGGGSWTVLTDDNQVLGVSDIIVISTTFQDILYIATGDKNEGSIWSLGGGQSNDNNSIGVLKSIDGGATWNTTALTWTVSQNRTIARLIKDYNNNNIIYAATSVGIYKTINAGTSWTLQQMGNFIDMEINPATSTTLYASTIDYNGSPKIYKTVNGGTNWTISKTYTSNDYRVDIAVTPANSTYVYAVVSDYSGGLSTVDRSTNTGSSFTQVFSGSTTNLLNWDCSSTSSGGQGEYDLCIAADPNNANTIFIGGINTWKSTNGGSTWSISTHWSGTCSGTASTVHADQHMLKFMSNGNLFLCNDGGLYKTTNSGTTWTDITNGMVISQLYRLGVGQASAGEVIAGLQDNGTKLYSSSSWADVMAGDGMECLIKPDNNNYQFAELYYGEIYFTSDHWSSSSNIMPSGAIGAWVTPYVLDPQNILYAGYQDVFKTTDYGNNWTKISTNLTGGTDEITSLAFAPSNNAYIYAAIRTKIYRTINGGSNWSNITNNLPVNLGSITYISVKNNDPNTVWVSVSGYTTGGTGVFETSNGGVSWTNISAGLPTLPTMCVIENKQATSTELYAGTDRGVYVKTGSSNWAAFNNNLPNVVVTELDIYYNNTSPSNSKLYAATFGRGLWESDLYTAVTAQFTGSPTSGVPPLTVSFTNQSAGNITSFLWSFGDGGSSSQQNPTHIYNTPGTYTVALTVTGPGGSDTETKTNYITVTYPAPVADFSGTPTSGDAPLTVNFTDASSGTINTYAWSFGDGGSSSQQNPTHIYNTPGTYTVALTVTGPGGSDTETKTNYITVTYPAPVADFSGTPTSGDAPLTVNFTDASSGTINTYAWSFGDGGSSSQQNPTHIYNTPGTYTVALTVTGPGGSDTETKTNYITVTYPAPVADFSGTPTSGDAPLTVNFTDASSGTINTYAWSFGDGGSSSQQNPTHIYNTPGTYTVALTVTGPGGSDTETKTNYITVTYPAPVADFSGTPTSGDAPLTVNFTDASSGTINTYAWSFGDGGSSSQQNPTHIYNTPGTYTVALTVTGPGGSDTETKTNYITVTYPAPVADFSGTPTSGNAPLTVNFTDASSGTINTYAWNFGDGGSSSQQNPTHIYNTPGTYTVALTVTGPGGSDTETKTNYITVTYPAPVADFSGTPTSGDAPLTVNFTDASSGTINTYAWSFGDGGSSSQQNPTHIYNTPGTYTVALTVTGPGGSDTETKTNYIIVTQAGDPLSVIVNTNPENICLGEDSQLNANAAGGTGTYTYSWTSDPTGFTSTIYNPVVSPTETTTYTVEVDDGDDIVTESIVVTVDEPPSFTGASQDISICENETANISASVINAGNTLWTTSGDGSFGNPNVLSTTYTSGTNDIINGSVGLTITAFGTGACSTTSFSDALVITIDILPENVYAGADAAICIGQSYSLSDATANNVSDISWNTSGDGVFSSPGVINVIYSPGYQDFLNGSVELILLGYGIGACNNYIDVDTMILYIYDYPTANAGNDQNLVNGTSTTLSGSATNGSGSYSWSWKPVSLLVNANVQNPTTIPLTLNTNFELTVTDIATECTDIDSVFIATNVGSQILKADDIEIFPNPFNNILTIKVKEKGNHTIKIINNLGKTILTKEFFSELKIDMKDLPAAIYQAEILSEKGRVLKKVIKL